MSIQNLLNQFMGATGSSAVSSRPGKNPRGGISQLANNIPGGLAGGAAAGGVMALLIGNKSARKFAGKAAAYGGAAVLGGIAFKAFKNWQENKRNPQPVAGYNEQNITNEDRFISSEVLSPDFELLLVKAMIASAKSDGHIDSAEQQRIFKAVEEMGLSAEMKGMVFDLLQRPIAIEELVQGAHSIEQKSELYLASRLVIDPDQPLERAYLKQLAMALDLPADLAEQINWQAQQALSEEAAA